LLETHREENKSKQILIVKDSWQYREREEKGELLREIIEKGVINVARYFHHETVYVGGKMNDIVNNIRKNGYYKASNKF
jgi:hypothetical protein